MAQIIDFHTRRPVAPSAAAEPKMCCARCGADVWTILEGGKVCCADCEETCPFRITTQARTEQ